MADSLVTMRCQQASLERTGSGAEATDQAHAKKKKKKRNKTTDHYLRTSNSSSSSSASSAENLVSVDYNNNKKPLKKQAKLAAVKFKYQHNSARDDIERLREILIQERDRQMGQLPSEELDFYRADFERMLVDDWLATRFLLRGKKAYERLLASEQASNRAEIKGERETREAIYRETLELVKVCAKFRFDYRINKHTKEAEFPLDWVKVHGLFHYKADRVGNPTVYLRVALHRPKLIESLEARHLFKRYMLYTLERCDQQLHNRPGKAICCIFDMTRVAFENIDLELTSWMIKSFKNCSPKLMCYVIIYNPPWFFTATFKLICSTLLSESKRQSVKFAHGNEIIQYIDYDNLPHYIQSAIDD